MKIYVVVDLWEHEIISVFDSPEKAQTFITTRKEHDGYEADDYCVDEYEVE